MISRTTYLNMVPSAVRPIVYISQYDVDSSALTFYLYNEDGTNFNIPSGYRTTITGAKPDDTVFSYECGYNGNQVTSDIKEQMSIVAGDVMCEISIQSYDTGQCIGTANFILRVEESPYYRASLSRTDVDNLHTLIQLATNEATYRAESAANNANASAEDARNAASAAHTYADSAQNSLNSTLQEAVNVKNSMHATATEFSTYVLNTSNDVKDSMHATATEFSTYVLNTSNDVKDSMHATRDEFAKYVSDTSANFKEEAKNLAEQYSREAVKDSESWAVGGTGTRDGEDMNNSKYYSEVSRSEAEAALNAAKLAKDYSTVVMPDFYFDIETAMLYEKAGVNVEVMLDEADLYWRISND
jgi:flagellar hook-basal body complex protein FliE